MHTLGRTLSSGTMMENLNLQTIKGCFPGSPSGALSDVALVDRILTMTGNFDEQRASLKNAVKVVYVGTAVYDIPHYFEHYTKHFVARGCTVNEIRLVGELESSANKSTAVVMVSPAQLRGLAEAHIILLPEGNALYAIQRWEETGFDTCLRAAAARGAVIVGDGCWFRALHSDSANPKTYAEYMLTRELKQASGEVEQADQQKEGEGEWEYVCVHGLGVLPGIFCPRHSSCDARGILLSESFSQMLKRHPSERGIGVDCRAALILLGDGRFQVVTTNTEGSPASVRDRGVQVKEVVDGSVKGTTIEEQGNVEELFRRPCGPVIRDPFEAYYAMVNPTPLAEKLLYAPGEGH